MGAQQTVNINFGGSAYIDLAIGNRRNRKLYGVSGLIARCVLPTAVEYRLNVGGIERIEHCGPRSWPWTTVLRTVDRPDNRAPCCRPIRRDRSASTGKGNERSACCEMREVRKPIGDRN